MKKLPLTELQKGILFEIKRSSERNYYINQEILHFNTKIDLDLMQKAFELVTAKYEILRSAITFDSHQPSFTIYKTVNIPFKLYDHSDLNNDKKEEIFNAFIDDDLATPMDITKAPLVRVSVLKFAKNDYRIVLDIHHLIVDASSITKIEKSLFEIYSALLKDEKYSPTDSVPYYDTYNYKNNLDINKAKDYWQDLLSDHDISTLLPCTSRKTTSQNKKNTKTIDIDGSKYRKLIDFAKNNSLTTNSLLQATWALVLSHYSSNKNVVFGSVRAYPREFTKDYAGLFINTLPMSFDIDPNTYIIDFLHQTRKQSKNLRDNVNLPLSYLHDWIKLPLDAPLYSSIINYKPFSTNKILTENFPKLRCRCQSRLDIPYPLVLDISDDSNSLKLNLHHEIDLFDDEYMDLFLNHYKDVLLQMIAEPNKQLANISIVNPKTFDQVVYAWNETCTNKYPLKKTVHQLFEEQAEKNPNAIVVAFGYQKLSYKKLNEKANQLAHHLIQLGVTAEDRIVLWAKPRLEILIGILAILKAGGAYVPIDISNPPERIKHIVEDSQPKFIVTETSQLKSLSEMIDYDLPVKPTIINLDQQYWNNHPTNNPLLPIKPTNLMYIIYTSGSTGKPKGAMIEHFSAVNMALSCGERLKISPESRILQIASFSFDVSVAEWCMALLSGASLYLIDKYIFSPQKMIDELKDYKITTTILSHSILAALPEADLPYLKVIAPGGEPLSQHTLDYWAKDRLLLNVYGITETSVCSTMAECTSKTKSITIGKPLANVKIYILNKQLQPVPPWVTGEIYIGGLGVGRGYWNKLSLSKEKFIKNPFITNNKGAFPKNRLYKTGDLGRWTNDGEIEFIGRVDDQIKIRGFRVEMSEIERNLEQYRNIEKAVAIPKLVGKNKQLIAYILASKNVIIDIENVWEYLKKYLPSYMIPTQIFRIDNLPLTSHGKIDKKKLLTMSNETEPDNSSKTAHEKCDTTNKILNIIKRLLQKPEVSIHKNFLDIGLDSIMLVELSSNLSAEFNQDIDITTLFTYTTIKRLASLIKNNSSQDDEDQSSFDSIKESIIKRKKC